MTTEYSRTPLTAAAEPLCAGAFTPEWASLQRYEVPEWFRDAKFGIWAHWGPQCEPERGDWYGRGMYEEGGWQYAEHLKRYGHPSEFGFKDVIHRWKADRWDPRKLVALYKRAGAKYFFAMANHHDNLDLWDSRHQTWNSVTMGPRKDLIAGWEAAARAEGLRFGVSVHAAHAWTWFETAQRADTKGPKAGEPYDGTLTKADGKGTWWDGYDPQDLYAQRHAPSAEPLVWKIWEWQQPGASIPDTAYCEKFYNRTVDLINRSRPDLVYFDDTVLPLYPISDVGLKIAAHFYNANMAWHGGRNEAVLFGKILHDEHKRALVWDIERGQTDKIEPWPFQTDTCLGSWHYDRGVYDRAGYKTAKTVVHMLADTVSKNGNLLLNVPVRGDGTIDELEERIVEEIGSWLAVNGEAIYGTRPWKVYGEGPPSAGAALTGPGFNEDKQRPMTEDDVRFTRKGNEIYAIMLGKPTKPSSIRALGSAAGHLDGSIAKVERLGGKGPVTWSHGKDALVIEPGGDSASELAVVYRVTTQRKT